MKRLVSALLLSLLFASQADAAMLFFWRAEGTTLDGTHDFTAGDNTATLASAAAINTDAARFGTNGLDLPTGADNANFTITTNDIVNPAEGSAAFSFRVTTWVAGNTLFHVRGTSANDTINVSMLGTDELRFRYRSTAGGVENVVLDTTAANIATATWYGVVVRWDSTADRLEIEVYNSSDTLIHEPTPSSSAISTQADITTLSWGDVSNTGSSDIHMDAVMVSNDADETLQSYLSYTSYTQIGGSSLIHTGGFQRLNRGHGPHVSVGLGGLLQ